MANQRYPITDYADWVRGEVLGGRAGAPSVEPADRVLEWREMWHRADDALMNANARFELLSLVVARWEFLGALCLGSVG
ncbi:MAG TPA: hypothetical protein VM580_34225, partial [Labilithrix sp.]|nr:hypothetical protein [Labilithrix sp.]